MIARTYIEAAYRVGWLLAALEDFLSTSAKDLTVDIGVVQRSSSGRMPSNDESAAAISALHAIGVLRHSGSRYRFSSEDFVRTQSYRCGVRDAINFVRNEPRESAARLCVAIPPGLPGAFAQKAKWDAVDLRAAILDVVASAERTLVLASPFWDKETIADISPVVARRMDAGVIVRILGRFGDEAQREAKLDLFSHLGHHHNCSVSSWFDDTAGQIQTFHFKVVIADNGKQAYLGTANLTSSGLRSRMEIGMILSGETGRQLFQIVDMTMSLGRSIQAI